MMTEMPTIGNKQDIGKSDKGKKVSVSTIAIRETGVVADGPYALIFKALTKKGAKKGKDGKVHSKEIMVTTEPYWLIRLDCNGFYIHCAKNEITFV